MNSKVIVDQLLSRHEGIVTGDDLREILTYELRIQLDFHFFELMFDLKEDLTASAERELISLSQQSKLSEEEKFKVCKMYIHSPNFTGMHVRYIPEEYFSAEIISLILSINLKYVADLPEQFQTDTMYQEWISKEPENFNMLPEHLRDADFVTEDLIDAFITERIKSIAVDYYNALFTYIPDRFMTDKRIIYIWNKIFEYSTISGIWIKALSYLYERLGMDRYIDILLSPALKIASMKDFSAALDKAFKHKIPEQLSVAMLFRKRFMSGSNDFEYSSLREFIPYSSPHSVTIYEGLVCAFLLACGPIEDIDAMQDMEETCRKIKQYSMLLDITLSSIVCLYPGIQKKRHSLIFKYDDVFYETEDSNRITLLVIYRADKDSGEYRLPASLPDISMEGLDINIGSYYKQRDDCMKYEFRISMDRSTLKRFLSE